MRHPLAGIRFCFYCDKILSRRIKTRDHLQPKSRKGSNDGSNLVDACRSCNTLKGQLTLEEFRAVMAYRAGEFKKMKLKFPGELRKSINGALR